MALAVVTGGGTGIGRALALALASSGHRVIAVGRRVEPLSEVAALSADISTVSADVSTPEGRTLIAEAVKDTHLPLSLLVHNAAALYIGPALQLTPEKWRESFAVNVDAPLFLTQALLPFMSRGGRILMIGSGAEHTPFAGWGPYCASKAALLMIGSVLRLELTPMGILVGSARPGVVDTPMQGRLRELDFPDVDRFKSMKAKRDAVVAAGQAEGGAAAASAAPVATPPPAGMLDSAENSAAFLHWLLTATSDTEFSSSAWDSRDAAHHARWTAAAGVGQTS